MIIFLCNQSMMTIMIVQHYLQDAVTRQTNLREVVVKCQGGYCGYSNTPLIIVIKS